jgi:hypothetical protein
MQYGLTGPLLKTHHTKPTDQLAFSKCSLLSKDYFHKAYSSTFANHMYSRISFLKKGYTGCWYSGNETYFDCLISTHTQLSPQHLYIYSVLFPSFSQLICCLKNLFQQMHLRKLLGITEKVRHTCMDVGNILFSQATFSLCNLKMAYDFVVNF